MELKKLLQYWSSFPEVSMEERPVLSSDLEKIVVKNPLSNAFYLRKKLVWRIGIIAGLWLISGWQLRAQWKTDGSELRMDGALFTLLAFSLFFHIRILLFANYPTLLALPLVNFLGKLEVILDKYIWSFKFVSAITGFYGMFLVEGGLARISAGAYESLTHNDWYKGLMVIFLAVSMDILLLHTLIPQYRKLLATVRKYREGIIAKAQNK
jgi:fucose 4-O-acetylase-like acetyltransferase